MEKRQQASGQSAVQVLISLELTPWHWAESISPPFFLHLASRTLRSLDFTPTSLVSPSQLFAGSFSFFHPLKIGVGLSCWCSFFFLLFFPTCSPGISLSLVLKAFICQASEFIYVSSLGFFPALAFQAVNSAQNSLPPDICMAFFSPFSGLCQDVIFLVRPTLTTLWKTTDLSL